MLRVLSEGCEMSESMGERELKARMLRFRELKVSGME